MQNFKHSCRALNDDRCVSLIHDLGFTGYGLYWGVVEILQTQDDKTLPTTIIPKLASSLRVKTKTLDRLIFEYGLFEKTQDGSKFRALPDGVFVEGGEQ